MASYVNPEKRMIRDACENALRTYDDGRQRLEVSVVDNQTLQVKVYGAGNPLPAYFTVKITGPS